MFKVWYINKDGKEAIEGNFDTIEEAYAHADALEAAGKIHTDCLNAEGARIFKETN